jgi:uncharacterized membrane protein YecN with MAPEG domain
MPITAFYASLLAFLFLLLSARVIVQRRDDRVELGANDSSELFRRARVHANFAEYVPMALLLLALTESLKAPTSVIHLLAICLVAGRLLHAYGLSQTPHILKWRTIGMVLTLTVIGIAALLCFTLAGLNLIV